MRDRSNNQLALVCNDDTDNCGKMRQVLFENGLQVIEAADGHQALRLFFEYSPSIVIINICHPGKYCSQLGKQIRASSAGQNVPIMITTNNQDPDSIAHYYRIGASDFMLRPIQWPLFTQRIDYMLKSSQTLENIRQRELDLKHQVKTDMLTGLSNRQSFTKELHQFLSLPHRKQTRCAVVMFDIDRFKRINDTLGHQFGDKLLQTIGRRLAMNLRGGDLLLRDSHRKAPIARLGGDKFIMVINHINNIEVIDAIIKRHIEAISQPVNVDTHEVVVTASVGVALCPQDGEDVDMLLKNTETAMYCAKELGGGHYKLYSDTLNDSDMERLLLEKELRQAVKQHQLTLHYQPQIDANTGQIQCLEALARWVSPTLGRISPEQFIPVAEECGLIIELGNWVLNTACAQAKRWLDADYAIDRIAVNVSGHQFRQPDFIQHVLSALHQSQLAPQHLELELTEGILMETAERNISLLKQLKELGVSLAVDDFGTGYSSLNYLKRFPIDTLKIDRSFVTDMLANADNSAIVEVIIALADKLQLRVVAEGVENSDQLHQLQQYQCTLMQGFYFSQPLPEPDISKLLADPSSLSAPAGNNIILSGGRFSPAKKYCSHQ